MFTKFEEIKKILDTFHPNLHFLANKNLSDAFLYFIPNLDIQNIFFSFYPFKIQNQVQKNQLYLAHIKLSKMFWIKRLVPQLIHFANSIHINVFFLITSNKESQIEYSSILATESNDGLIRLDQFMKNKKFTGFYQINPFSLQDIKNLIKKEKLHIVNTIDIRNLILNFNKEECKEVEKDLINWQEGLINIENLMKKRDIPYQNIADQIIQISDSKIFIVFHKSIRMAELTSFLDSYYVDSEKIIIIGKEDDIINLKLNSSIQKLKKIYLYEIEKQEKLLEIIDIINNFKNKKKELENSQFNS